jgi:hypothetical protein
VKHEGENTREFDKRAPLAQDAGAHQRDRGPEEVSKVSDFPGRLGRVDRTSDQRRGGWFQSIGRGADGVGAAGTRFT